jgi:hypothetical protein
VLTTNQKGAIAEAAIVNEAVRLGIGVWRPFADHERYDVILDVGAQLLRVQCKYAPRRGEVVVIRLRTARRTSSGMLRTLYSSGEIDAFAAYCPETDRCYFLPLADCIGRFEVCLRLTSTLNNQRNRVNWARDYEFGAKLGAVLGP